MQHNRIYFGGYVGADTTTFTTSNGVQIANFSLCYSQKGKDGRPDVTTWVRVKVFGNWVEYAQRFKKGDNVFVEGTFQVSNYKDKQGVDRTAPEIAAYSLAKIEKPPAKPNPGGGQKPEYTGAFNTTDDDIPF